MKKHEVNMSRLPVEMHSFRVAKIREAVQFEQTDGKTNLWAKLYKNTMFKEPDIRNEWFFNIILTFFTLVQ